MSAAIHDGTHGSFERVDDGVPFLSAKNVHHGEVVISDSDSRISREDYETLQQADYLRPGDVLLTIVGSIGRSAIFDGGEVAFQRSVASIRPSPLISSGFLDYWLQGSILQDSLATATKAAAQGGVYLGDLAAMPVPVPPIPLQGVVVDFLDRETNRLDALVDAKKRLTDLLAEKRTAMIIHAVTKGLDPSVPMKDSGVEWLGKIPAHWEVGQGKRFFECLDGRRIPLNAEQRAVDPGPGPYPYHGANGIVDWIDGYLFDEPLVLLGEDGAPFLEPNHSVARVVSGKIWVNNHAHVLRPANIEARFLAESFNVVDYSKFIGGSTRDKLTQEQMNGVPIALPPQTEQETIVRYLERRDILISALSARLAVQLALLLEYRQALITAAVTGQLDDATLKGDKPGDEAMGFEVPA